MAWNQGQSVGDPFFEDVSYIGAFDNTSNWALQWTALDAYGYFGSLVSGIDDPALSEVDDMMQVYPNPVSQQITVSFELGTVGEYSIGIVNQLGQLVHISETTGFATGLNTVEMDVHDLVNGLYLVTINDASGSIIGRRVVVKNAF